MQERVKPLYNSCPVPLTRPQARGALFLGQDRAHHACLTNVLSTSQPLQWEAIGLDRKEVPFLLGGRGPGYMEAMSNFLPKKSTDFQAA